MDEKMFDVILTRMHEGFRGVHLRLDTLHRDVIAQGKEIAALDVRTSHLERQIQGGGGGNSNAFGNLFNSPAKASAWSIGGILTLLEVIPRILEAWGKN